MKMKYIILGFLALVFFAACKKDFDGRAPENANITGSAYIRFFAGSMGAARNFISIDNQRLNGAPLAMGGVFPGASTTTAFATIPAEEKVGNGIAHAHHALSHPDFLGARWRPGRTRTSRSEHAYGSQPRTPQRPFFSR